MTDGQILALLIFSILSVFIGFASGYYIGYDRAFGIKSINPKSEKWYQWASVKVKLDDHIHDYELAREVNAWLRININENDYAVFVHNDESQLVHPIAVFYIRDRNIALTLSIKYNIMYSKGFS